MQHEHEHRLHAAAEHMVADGARIDASAHVRSPHGMVFTFNTDTGPLLLSAWHPHNTAEYAVSLMIIFALGLAAEYCASKSRSALVHEGDPAKRRLFAEQPQLQALSPATSQSMLLHAGSIAINLCLMLLTMTLNAGVFASVVLGLALGRATWGKIGAGSASHDCS